ncbi:MAG: GH12 family glycosyl hydrolase domain-containing protein [Rhodoferax sp.]
MWNPGAATSYKQCTSATIQSSGGVTAAEFDWDFTSANSDVKTYPNLQFGQQNASNPSTTPLLPVAIAAMPSLTATGTITTACATAVPCYFDSGFDVFFSSTVKPTNLIQGELMIITSYNFTQPLGGWAATNVSIGGATYNLRQFEMKSGGRSWPYVAYYATSPITRIHLDIKDFVTDAVKRGYIPASYYVDMVEIGTEALSGHGITKITDFNIQ